MNYNEIFTAHQPSNGRAVLRSTNGGVSFTDMTNDARTHPVGIHPDQHALVFDPANPDGFFESNDGGIVRVEGPYVDKSASCDTRGLTAQQLADCHHWLSAIPSTIDSLSAGLNTLQFQSVSVSPFGSEKGLLGGTQDNGTWAFAAKAGDGGDKAFESVGGDGGQSGFDAVSTAIDYHSYYAPQHDVNFHGTNPNAWDWISDRLLGSGDAASFYTPFTADPVVGGTVFDGLQHVFRSTDHGGDAAYEDKVCNELTGTFAGVCGDFTPLGNAKVDDNPNSKTYLAVSKNDSGDLTGSHYGTARAGGYIVALSRSTTDTHTMWAATRTGRVFLSRNIDAADRTQVSYKRVDTANTPGRFVSGIAIDPADPYHAFVSYSGYSAYSPGGHVYEVRVNRANGNATWTDRSGNLGDLPVTGLVRAANGDLYASTDFGVLRLPTGSGTWSAPATGLPAVTVYGLTIDARGKRLYAATHGRGVYVLKL